MTPDQFDTLIERLNSINKHLNFIACCLVISGIFLYDIAQR